MILPFLLFGVPFSGWSLYLRYSYLGILIVFSTDWVPTFIWQSGSELLIRELPSILDGSARLKAQPQDDSKATLAPKVCEPWFCYQEAE